MEQKEVEERSRLEQLKQLTGMTLLSLSHIPDERFDETVKVIKNFFGVYFDIRDEYTYAELLDKMIHFGLDDTTGEMISKFIETLSNILYKDYKITSSDVSNLKNRFIELVNHLAPEDTKPTQSAKKQPVFGLFGISKSEPHLVSTPENLEKEIALLEKILVETNPPKSQVIQLKLESLKGDLKLWRVDARAIDVSQMNLKLDGLKKELPQHNKELDDLEAQANDTGKQIAAEPSGNRADLFKKELESVQGEIKELRAGHGDIKHLKAKLDALKAMMSQKPPVVDPVAQFDAQIAELEKAISSMDSKKSGFLKLELDTLKGDLKLMKTDPKSFNAAELTNKIEGLKARISGKPVPIQKPAAETKSIEKPVEQPKESVPEKAPMPSNIESEITQIESLIASSGDLGIRGNFVKIELESLKNDLKLFKVDPKAVDQGRVDEKIKSIKKLLGQTKVEKKPSDEKTVAEPIAAAEAEMLQLEKLVNEAEKKGSKNPFLRLEFESLKADFDLMVADPRALELSAVTRKVQAMKERFKKLGLLVK